MYANSNVKSYFKAKYVHCRCPWLLIKVTLHGLLREFEMLRDFKVRICLFWHSPLRCSLLTFCLPSLLKGELDLSLGLITNGWDKSELLFKKYNFQKIQIKCFRISVKVINEIGIVGNSRCSMWEPRTRLIILTELKSTVMSTDIQIALCKKGETRGKVS